MILYLLGMSRQGSGNGEHLKFSVGHEARSRVGRWKLLRRPAQQLSFFARKS